MRGLAAIVALAGCGGGDGSAITVDGRPTDTPPATTGWSTGAAVANGAIQETAAAAVDGKIYVVGGFNSGAGIVASVQVYDTATDTWSDGPALPAAVHHASVATDGTRIYVAGALVGGNFQAVGAVYSLAPSTETSWQTHASIPVGRERGAAIGGFIDGKLYIASGFGSGASALVDVFDPQTNTWSPGAPLPGPRDHACGGVIDGQLVVAGGRTNALFGDVWSYSPGTDTWTPRAAMPTPRAGMGCGVIDNVLYATGGEGNGADATGVFANVEAFTLATNTWAQLAPMPNPKHGVGGAVWNGALYLAGGADVEGFGAIADVDIYRP